MVENKKKSVLKMEISIGGIRDIDMLFFTRHLALAVRSGLTLFDSLIMLHDQSSGKLKKILGQIMQMVQAGEAFHSALAHYPKYFSDLYVNLVKTGEIAGTLEGNLNYLAEHLQKKRELKQKVTSAMMYPTLIFVAVVGLGFSIALFVLPKILPLFDSLHVELPLPTEILIFVTKAFTQYGHIIGLITFIIIAFLAWLIRQNFVKPFTHRILLSLPILKTIVRNINLQRFTHTFATLLMSGIPVDASLKITADATENRVYRKMISNCMIEVQKGNMLAECFSSYPKYFPKMLKYMVAMGEKTGNLDSTLRYLSQFYEAEVDTFMKNLSTIIEPFMLIFIGSIVGMVAIAILGPIYQLTGSLK